MCPTPPQPCTSNGLPPAAAHQRYLAPRPNGGQQRCDDLPLPVRCLQLSAGRTAYHVFSQASSVLLPVCNESDWLSSQGVFIFFFHVIFNKEVRKNLKNVFSGKKSIPDESSTTRASLLTVSDQTNKARCVTPQLVLFNNITRGCSLSLQYKFFFSAASPPDRSSLHPQRTLNCNNTFTEDGALYRSGIGESNVSLDSTLRSAKSRSSYLAYTLRYNTLTDRMAASTTLLHDECVCVYPPRCALLLLRQMSHTY